MGIRKFRCVVLVVACLTIFYVCGPFFSQTLFWSFLNDGYSSFNPITESKSQFAEFSVASAHPKVVEIQAREMYGFRFSVHPVPRNVSRFDFPWFSLNPIHNIALDAARGRILYSPNSLHHGDGLGHACSTLHAEVVTAWRLGIAYSHRTGKYGSLTDSFLKKDKKSRHFFFEYENPAAVENFLGMGSEEISRESIQRSICPARKMDVDVVACNICLENDRIESLDELHKSPLERNRLRIDHVVEIPSNLSYNWRVGDRELEMYRNDYIRRNNLPYTAFVMPPKECDQVPLYSVFTEASFSYFFNKYWNTHASNLKKKEPQKRNRDESISYVEFQRNHTKSIFLPRAKPRSLLTRLKESEIVIAVHARRGDFFEVGRPMISVHSFIRVIRQVISIVQGEDDGVFSSMNFSVSIYSEGQAKNGLIGHNISRQHADLVDADGEKVTKKRFLKEFFKEQFEEQSSIPKTAVDINFRISESTILSLHEMIAADVFIGSQSGMSQNLISSRSRAAFQILPEVEKEASDRLVKFDSSSGEINHLEKQHAIALWSEFVKANSESARRAIEHNRHNKL